MMPGVRPRNSESAARWRGIVGEQGLSGLSVAAFWQGRGLALSTFFAWTRRLAGVAAPGLLASGGETGLVEAEVVGDFAAGAESSPPTKPELREGGRRVVVLLRGFDAALLRQVLVALEGGLR